MFSLYESFYLQFSTYQDLEHTLCKDGKTKATTARFDREPPPTTEGTKEQVDEYWLRILLKLRLAETKTYHSTQNLNFFSSQATKRYRLFGLHEALKYVNDLTRGFHVTKFLSKGSYWYGISEKEYRERKESARQNALNPEYVDYALTGTGNTK